MKTEQREIWVDWLRVSALFMVMLTHSCEPFYLGGEGSLILTEADAWWVSILNVLPRAAVALFIVASSYLQFPLHYSTGEFFRRRAVRVLVPFVIWTVFYAFWWGEPVQNFKDLLLNFNYAAGHLWFVYMLVGLYLIMPLLSPWAEKVSKKELRIYLVIWLLTTLLPLVRQWMGGVAPVIYGPGGIPNPARYPIWGEASWNSYGVFYYLSGFVGYLLLGLYFRKFGPQWSLGKSLAVALPLFASGFAIACLGFLRRVWADCGGYFPVEGPIGMGAQWEGPWLNDTIGVAMMAIAWILLFRHFRGGGAFYRRIVLPVSKASYGMYLMHMVFLAWFAAYFRELLYDPAAPYGWTTPVIMLSTALSAFLASAVVSVLLQRIPRVGKYLVG